ncbi:hypothetical protein [Streptomyces sp. F001]|uniref:hypothetical protein n=1 Tax=Streptomyces sp. F001 TaxID=1510026 RepID=UPI001F10D31E|nr:hypothetical protein [Streptomyces sp. F001]
MDPSVMTVAIVIAALVIKTAVLEFRDPGTARREWAFVRDGVALAGGSVTALAVSALGWPYGGMGAVAWALLAGLLVAQVMGRRSRS